jgi:hypothetical protein
MKTTDTVPKTSVLGTLRISPQNPGVYAWNSVPKAIPKSKSQKPDPVDELWDRRTPARAVLLKKGVLRSSKRIDVLEASISVDDRQQGYGRWHRASSVPLLLA